VASRDSSNIEKPEIVASLTKDNPTTNSSMEDNPTTSATNN